MTEQRRQADLALSEQREALQLQLSEQKAEASRERQYSAISQFLAAANHGSNNYRTGEGLQDVLTQMESAVLRWGLDMDSTLFRDEARHWPTSIWQMMHAAHLQHALASELRKVGYSKERRVDPQIVVGLLVDRGGFPLEIGCFEGNKAETATIVPIIKQFQARHGLADMVVVADAGMLSAGQPARAGRGEPAVHRRLPDDQGSGRPGLALPLARRRVHRRAADRHHHPQNRPQEGEQPRPARRTRLGPRHESGSWRACGPTPARERSATPPPSRPRRTGPARSSRDRRRPGPRASSRPPAGNAASTRRH
jgi:hypothetical protein